MTTQEAVKPPARRLSLGASSGVFGMGALQRLGLSLSVSLLVAAAAWWALAG
jgi:hypothetical protein